MGFSAHKVPSLSKVAIRSDSGTRSGDPSRVTRSTNATIARFDATSLHEGSGSAAAVTRCEQEGTRLKAIADSRVMAFI
jgi:hypothetical protein